MANHKSAEKRVRQNAVKRLNNRYFARTTRNAVRALKNTTEKEAAQTMLPRVCSMLDKLAQKNIIHNNKAANLKSSATKYVASL